VLTALLERPAERDVVAAVDLVGLDAEALAAHDGSPSAHLAFSLNT
jgi:hypothetical protein